jgi:hypothetical protein
MYTAKGVRMYLGSRYEIIARPIGANGLPYGKRTFIIDDRRKADINKATGWPFYTFHQLSIQVVTGIRVRVTMRGLLPAGPEFDHWIQKVGATMDNNVLSFEIRKGKQGRLKKAAGALYMIVAPGRRYDVPSYKYT